MEGREVDVGVRGLWVGGVLAGTPDVQRREGLIWALPRGFCVLMLRWVFSMLKMAENVRTRNT